MPPCSPVFSSELVGMICAVWLAIIIGLCARYIVLGVINISGECLQRGWTDGRTKMWKKFLFPLRKTSRFVVFVLYKLSKVPDVNLKKKRKERNSLCRGDLKSIALRSSLFFFG